MKISVEEVQGIIEKFINSRIFLKKARKINKFEPLVSSGLLDSFHLVDLALFAEDTFDVIINDHELNRDYFNTLEELTALVHGRL
ncbi:MAG: hypothetical protein JEZ00_15080 [Anaerolineaceae bacterium]|nr:hypothetical protein [Anaerolineaceae bacterium]